MPSARSGPVVTVLEAGAAAVLALVMIFFCLSALFQLLHAAVFGPDWYHPLIVTFAILFAVSSFVSIVALITRFTASAISTVATPLFFMGALIASARIQVVLAGAWLLLNAAVGALAYRHRAGYGASWRSHSTLIVGHLILSVVFLPVTLLQDKPVSMVALTVGVLVGLLFAVVCVLGMPSITKFAGPSLDPPGSRR